jgi:hypothetical protein
MPAFGLTVISTVRWEKGWGYWRGEIGARLPNDSDQRSAVSDQLSANGTSLADS